METFDPHKNTTQVRQADGRQTNLRVLVVGTLVVIAAFALIFLAFQLFSSPGS